MKTQINTVMTTGEAVSEVRLNSRFIELHNWDRQEQLDRKTTTTKPVQKETPRTPSKMARPYLPNPVMLQYHICVRLSLMTFTWRLCFSGCRRKRYSVCDIDWVFWSLKFMCSCICLSGDCKHAVKISTCHVQMRWLLKGMGDGALIGLLHVTPKIHLRVIELLRATHFRFASGARVIYPPV